MPAATAPMPNEISCRRISSDSPSEVHVAEYRFTSPAAESSTISASSVQSKFWTERRSMPSMRTPQPRVACGSPRRARPCDLRGHLLHGALLEITREHLLHDRPRGRTAVAAVLGDRRDHDLGSLGGCEADEPRVVAQLERDLVVVHAIGVLQSDHLRGAGLARHSHAGNAPTRHGAHALGTTTR